LEFLFEPEEILLFKEGGSLKKKFKTFKETLNFEFSRRPFHIQEVSYDKPLRNNQERIEAASFDDTIS